MGSVCGERHLNFGANRMEKNIFVITVRGRGPRYISEKMWFFRLEIIKLNNHMLCSLEPVATENVRQ